MRPLDPHPSSVAHARGRHIETELLRRFGEARVSGRIDLFAQPDAFAITTDGSFYFIEAKGQSAFEPPPFAGHGLPVEQVERYERIRKATGIRTLFIVWDPECWFQWIDVLEQGQSFDTRGTIKKPRRIYPLTSFLQAPNWRAAS